MKTKALRATYVALALAAPLAADAPLSGAPMSPPASPPAATEKGRGDASKSAYQRPAMKWVLLTNDAVMSGMLSQDDAGYILHEKHGKGRLPPGRVALVANSLEEIYSHKKKPIPDNDLDERMKLARWCLVNHLEDVARKELREIQQRDPKHPAAALLQTLERAQSPKARVGDEAAAPGEMVQLGNAFGEGAIEYARHMQTVIFNRCGGNCHTNPRYDGEFKLTKQARMPASLTARNLSKVERFLDLKDPGKSKLLQYAITPHGPRNQAPFGGPNDPRYQELRAWVYSMSSNWQEGMKGPDGKLVAAGDDATRPGVTPSNSAPLVARGKMQPPKDRAGFTAAADDAPPSNPPEMPNSPPKSAPKKAPAKSRKGDPVDPDVFNTGGGKAGGEDPGAVYEKWYKAKDSDFSGGKKN
ncbi:MAG TPA: hypothetical protein VNC50_02955 [Planctomycetia bacterium]|nr:hypothetical protein [Planctomycetia bacterium]